MAEGKAQSYEKAELAMKLMDLKFDEDEAIYAANECTSLYTAISYLQQDCELCASKYGVKEVTFNIQKPHPVMNNHNHSIAVEIESVNEVFDCNIAKMRWVYYW